MPGIVPRLQWIEAHIRTYDMTIEAAALYRRNFFLDVNEMLRVTKEQLRRLH